MPFALGMALLAAPPAFAGPHAALIGATPSADSVAQGAPGVVVLDFNTGVQTASSHIAVKDSTGRRVDANDLHQIGNTSHLAVSLKTLLPGRYVVNWGVTAIGAGQASGSYAFTVAQ